MIWNICATSKETDIRPYLNSSKAFPRFCPLSSLGNSFPRSMAKLANQQLVYMDKSLGQCVTSEYPAFTSSYADTLIPIFFPVSIKLKNETTLPSSSNSADL